MNFDRLHFSVLNVHPHLYVYPHYKQNSLKNNITFLLSFKCYIFFLKLPSMPTPSLVITKAFLSIFSISFSKIDNSYLESAT